MRGPDSLPPSMEPQAEERTLVEPAPPPSGASGSRTPDEEERAEGGATPAATPAGASGDSTSADGLWGLPVEHAERRPECDRCR